MNWRCSSKILFCGKIFYHSIQFKSNGHFISRINYYTDQQLTQTPFANATMNNSFIILTDHPCTSPTQQAEQENW